MPRGPPGGGAAGTQPYAVLSPQSQYPYSVFRFLNSRFSLWLNASQRIEVFAEMVCAKRS